jgi:uncharacterized membrane protein YfcA
VTSSALVDLSVGAAAFFAAGAAKGAVGFAFPMIAVSGLALTLPVDRAVAVSILPTLASNLAQAFRNGPRAAAAATLRFWPMNLAAICAVGFGTWLAPGCDEAALALLLGGVTTLLGLWLLLGLPMPTGAAAGRPAEGLAGALGGAFGALIGFATPPILLWYAAQPLARAEFLRALGATFLLVSLAMTAAHAGWGGLDGAAARLGAAALIPSAAGLWLGGRVGGWMAPRRIERVCLVLLAACGVAILRRGLV